jgi:hypothetical protein
LLLTKTASLYPLDDLFLLFSERKGKYLRATSLILLRRSKVSVGKLKPGQIFSH